VQNERSPDLSLFLGILRTLESIGAFAGAVYGVTRSSSEYLYSENQGADALDFSTAAIEYCKVIEFELRERLVDSLADRLDRPWISLGQLAYLLQDAQNSKTYPMNPVLLCGYRR
jgi:hypothetical protein